jgi:hypothetical protein
MNLCACKDLSNIELLNVQTVTAVTVMINSAMRTSSLFDVRWPADHSIEASPIARRSLVSGSDVKRERSESRSDAEGALDSRTGDQILQKWGGRAPDSALIGVGDNRHIAVDALVERPAIGVQVSLDRHLARRTPPASSALVAGRGGCSLIAGRLGRCSSSAR